MDQLPDQIIVAFLERLADFRDVLSFQATCKRFKELARSPLVWKRQLADRFGLSVREDGSQALEWQALFQDIWQTPTDAILRYYGVFTDGGVDEDFAQYWVDHAFTPNHYASYCSALSANVNCIGVLLEGPPACDAQQAAHRAFMIRRCTLPAAVLFGAVRDSSNAVDYQREAARLEQWSTAELEIFLLELWHEMQQGSALGRLLLAGLTTQESVQQEAVRLQAVVQQLPGPGRGHPLRGVISPPKLPHTLLDPSFLVRTAESGPVVGTLHKISVSRAGIFSCPVSAGVIFAATCPMQGLDSKSGQEVLLLMQELAAHRICKLFDDMATLDAVHSCRELAQLGPCTVGYARTGQWVEFAPPDPQNPNPMAPGGPSGGLLGALHPVAWFRFYHAGEPRCRLLQGQVEGNTVVDEDGNAVQLPPYGEAVDLLPPSPPSPPAAAGQSTPGADSQATSGSNAHAAEGPAFSSAAAGPSSSSAATVPVTHTTGTAGEASTSAAAGPSTSAASEPRQSPGFPSERSPGRWGQSSSEAGTSAMDGAGDIYASCAGGVTGETGGPSYSGAAAEIDAEMGAAEGFPGPSWHTAYIEEELESYDEGTTCESGSELDASDSDGNDINPVDLPPVEIAIDTSDDEGGLEIDDDEEGPTGRQTARNIASNTLEIRLKKPHAGNLILVKLIDQENRMEEWHDQHEAPNIDIASVKLFGRRVVLPPGASLLYN